MKRFYSFLAVAAVAVAALVSCGKDDNGGTIRSARNADDALLLDLGVGGELELFGDGKYVHKKPAAPVLIEKTKVGGDFVYITGSYKKIAEGQYNLEGYATVAIEIADEYMAEVTLTVNGEEPETFEATIMKIAAVNAAAKKLCITWVVDQTTIKINDGGRGVGRDFKGLDLNEIQAWVEDKGYYIDAEIPENQKLIDLALSESGKLALSFENDNDYVAQVDLTDFTGSVLSYVWEAEGMGAEILDGEATFTTKGNKGTLTFSGTVKDKASEYKVSVIFEMSPAK